MTNAKRPLATSSTGTLASRQDYDPWGAVRSGNLPQTTLGFTGQRRDGTGLLYYHARMYDPVLARFVSADSVVPGTASGSLQGIARKPLTVDFHEVGFGATLNSENGQPFWFQLSDTQRQQVGDPWGPTNPQALNRYSYVLNAPVRYSDPSGHGEGDCDTGPGCGGTVYNHTNHSIWVVGSVGGPCPGGDPSAKTCNNVMVEVPAGMSSADVGVYDADAVVIGERHGYEATGYKILSSERADVYEDDEGNMAITAEPKSILWIPATMFGRIRRFMMEFDWNRVKKWPVAYYKRPNEPVRKLP